MHIEQAKECLAIEADAIRSLIPRIDGNFVTAIEKIIGCTGRVVVTGMGKSGLIGRKIAATLASTGTPAFFFASGRRHSRRFRHDYGKRYYFGAL